MIKGTQKLGTRGEGGLVEREFNFETRSPGLVGK
jgi:hypothetical protein